MAHSDKEMAGYWAKLPLLQRLMMSHPKVEWIWLMDNDSMFTDMGFELSLDKYKNYNFVLHGWENLVYGKQSWIGLNTGSFLIQNCQWYLDILDAWEPMGPKGRIKEEAGKVVMVDKYEDMIQTYHLGLGDERWHFVTHFVGCKPCGNYEDYPVERYLKSMERDFNFADNQIRQIYRFKDKNLNTSKVKRTGNETASPLEVKDEFNLLHPSFTTSKSL
eukprot:PITA_28694